MSMKSSLLWLTAFCLASRTNICEAKYVLSADFFSQASPFLSEDSYTNCGNAGVISDVSLPFCDRSPCVLMLEEEVTLEYAFTADKDLPRLNFDLNLVDNKTGQVHSIRHSASSSRVEAGRKYESYTRFEMNSSFPEGKGLLLEILRSFEQSQICARIPVVINTRTSTTTLPTEATTQSPTTTTTVESTTIDASPATTTTTTAGSTVASPIPTTTTETDLSTSCPAFACEAEGIFPDPCDCSAYHTCQHYINGTLWDIELRCPEPTVWCQDLLSCDYSSTCPCQ